MDRNIVVSFSTEDGSWKHTATIVSAETDRMEQKMKEAFREFCRKIVEEEKIERGD